MASCFIKDARSRVRSERVGVENIGCEDVATNVGKTSWGWIYCLTVFLEDTMLFNGTKKVRCVGRIV